MKAYGEQNAELQMVDTAWARVVRWPLREREGDE